MPITNVSVIIPTLNEELFIEACLQSVFAQTYPQDALDIMIIDGGSCDRTCECVSQIRQVHNNVRLIDNPQKIQSVAFNIGVKSSDAPIVIRLDAHATYDENYIALCVRHLENKKYGNVGGKCSICHRHNSIIALTNATLNKIKFGIGGASFRVDNRSKEVDTVPFGAFRRDVIDEVGLMNKLLPRGEDNEYNCRIREAGYKIFFDPQIVATYYARDTIKGCVKQMYANGVSIGSLLRYYRQAVGLRHIIPMLFVISIILLIILSIVSPICRLGLITGLILYGVIDILACMQASMKYGWRNMFLLPILIPIVHISYGIGTIEGIVRPYK